MLLGPLAVGALLLLAACGGAKPGTPPLPDGLSTLRTVRVDTNALTFVLPSGPTPISASVFGGAAGETLETTAMEFLLVEPGVDYAMRFTFADEEEAERALVGLQGTVEGRQAAREDARVTVVQSNDQWGERVRTAWESGSNRRVSRHYPTFWKLLDLMPDSPPAPPVAAGFVRNVADLLDALTEAGGTGSLGLSNALGLVRAGTVAFVAYADSLGTIPSAPGGNLLRGLDVDVAFVAEGEYPGFIIDLLFTQFASAAGLEARHIEFDGATETASAYYRQVGMDLHLMVKTYGSTLFFAASPTAVRAETLMASIIRSQSMR